MGYQPDVSARKKINYQVSRELLISRSWHIKGAAKIVCLQKTGLAGTAQAEIDKLKTGFQLIHFYFSFS